MPNKLQHKDNYLRAITSIFYHKTTLLKGSCIRYNDYLVKNKGNKMFFIKKQNSYILIFVMLLNIGCAEENLFRSLYCAKNESLKIQKEERTPALGVASFAIAVRLVVI